MLWKFFAERSAEGGASLAEGGLPRPSAAPGGGLFKPERLAKLGGGL